MEYKDYYKVMSLSRDATQDEIKRAYKKLARKYHPDVSKEANAAERFKELGEAYEVLRDPEKRAAYDQLGSSWKTGQEFQPPPDWAEGFEFHGGGFTPGSDRNFSDFFESLFGGSFQQAQPHRRGTRQFHAHGEDTHSKVIIDIEDAYQGASRNLILQHSEIGPDGRPQLSERTLRVNIPKGIHPGQQIRLAGQGGPAVGQGRAGDLYLEVEFKPHSHYRVEGSDVFLNLPLAPWEAALGAVITIPTPTGPVELKIPPNSKNGSKLRLAKRGLPANRPGDFYVLLQITLPPANSDEEKAFYQQMQKQFAFSPRQDLGV